MKSFEVTKKVNAKPMSRQEYNDLRGWILPADEAGNDEGYLLEDINSPSNLDGFSGYVSWVPKTIFEASYMSTSHPLDRMAIENMQLIERLKPLDSLLSGAKPERISEKQWDLMKIQQKHMTGYFNTLDERIEDLAVTLGM